MVVGFRFDNQHIAGKLRAGMQGTVGFGVHEGAAVIHQVGFIQVALGLEPFLIAVQRRHSQRQPTYRAQ